MLQYLNQGLRKFGAHPIAPHARLNWEFYGVLEGRCAPVLPGQPEQPLSARTLWVFAPWQVHGWRGERGTECRVVCFHFAFVPSPLEELLRSGSFGRCELGEAEAQRLLSLAGELRQHFQQPTRLTHLVFHRALIELTILALKKQAREPVPELVQSLRQKVEAAQTWYCEHMAESPTIEEVAQNLHVSPSHLRRLFMMASQESPQSAFKRLRMQRAMELLSETGLKIESIAADCGYGNSSDFCRAFRSEFHISPKAWRENDYRTVPNAALRPDWLGEGSWSLHKPFVNSSVREAAVSTNGRNHREARSAQ